VNNVSRFAPGRPYVTSRELLKESGYGDIKSKVVDWRTKKVSFFREGEGGK